MGHREFRDRFSGGVKRILYLVRSVQTVFLARLPSHVSSTYQGVKRPEYKTDHSPLSFVEVKNFAT
jgi:hypothetical protein